LKNKNLLFVCSRNQWRSPTGEAVWAKESGVNARSAGTSPNARRTITEADIRWADMVFVMENKHRSIIKAKFGRAAEYAVIHVLGVPDDYRYMDPELVDLLVELVEPYMR